MVHAVEKGFSHAFNEAEPNAFLNTACRQLPGSAKLAQWCYRDGCNLIYNGESVKQSTRGQQGCPLLMMPMFCAMKKGDAGSNSGGCSVRFCGGFC